jgi:transcriptional regulator with XRE-family HTH domain
MIVMLFADKIRRLRDEKRMLQWQFAATMDIDAPLFSKIKRGKRHAKHEQVIAIAKNFKVNRNDFLSHWLAEQVSIMVADEQKVTDKALDIVKENIENN